MRAPPAAVWRVVRDPRWQALQSLLWAFTAGVLAWWAGSWASAVGPVFLRGDGAAGMPLTALVVSVFAGFLGWRKAAQPQGRLLWTGRQWRWQDEAMDSVPVDVGVDAALDLGAWLLLRLRVAGVPRAKVQPVPAWVSVRGPQGGGGGEPLQWIGFRAAVYSAASHSGGRDLPLSPRTPNDRSGL